MSKHIRRAASNDLEDILAWGEALWKTELTFEERMIYSKEEIQKHYQKELQSELALFLIVEFEGKPVGYLYAHIDPEPDYLVDRGIECELEVIYIIPEARRKGLAAALIQHCLGWAKEKNTRRVKAGIFAQNTASLNVFRHSGFKDYHLTLFKDLEK